MPTIDPAGDHPGALLARLDRPRTDQPTRFAVLADPHVSTREAGTSKLFEHTEAHLQNAIADVQDRDVDAVLSAGDLTKDGEPWNVERVDEILADLDVPFYGVPGNHDVPKERDDADCISLDEYATRYAPDGEYPFHVEVGGVDVLGLNSSGSADRLYDTHEGEVDADQLDWLADRLDETETPLVLVHHNLPPMADQLREHRDAVEPEMFIPPEIRNGEALAETMRAGDAPLMLTGHLHMPATATMDGVREVMAPTTCSFPQGYLLVEVGPDGTEMRFVPVADRAGIRTGFHERSTDSETARGLNAMAAIRLARFPLVDERADWDEADGR